MISAEDVLVPNITSTQEFYPPLDTINSLKNYAEQFLCEGTLVPPQKKTFSNHCQMVVGATPEGTPVAAMSYYSNENKPPDIIAMRALSPSEMRDLIIEMPYSQHQKVYGYTYSNTDNTFSEIAETWGMFAFPFYANTPERETAQDTLAYMIALMQDTQVDREETELQTKRFQKFLNSS